MSMNSRSNSVAFGVVVVVAAGGAPVVAGGVAVDCTVVAGAAPPHPASATGARTRGVNTADRLNLHVTLPPPHLQERGEFMRPVRQRFQSAMVAPASLDLGVRSRVYSAIGKVDMGDGPVDSVLRIGELAAHAGTRADTVRYYERLGLMGPPGHTESGYGLSGKHAPPARLHARLRRVLGVGLRIKAAYPDLEVEEIHELPQLDAAVQGELRPTPSVVVNGEFVARRHVKEADLRRVLLRLQVPRLSDGLPAPAAGERVSAEGATRPA